HVERLLDAWVAGRVPAEQPTREDQVTARRDRQELRQPLHEAEHDRLDDGHGGQTLPGVIGEGLTLADQVPERVTSRITRLTPAARIGSQSTSPPISTTSSSIRCRVDAIVNSRTGSATCPPRII